jgi:hypothetical protein
MPILLNPNTGKPVDVADAYIDVFTRAGFKEQEPAVEAVDGGEESRSEETVSSSRRGRPRKKAE